MKKILFLLIMLLFPISTCALEYPKIDSKNVKIYDLTDKKTLYEVNANDVSAIASLTKIATTITAIENIENLDEKVTITNDILNTVSKEASKAGLKDGDVVTYNDLLYASMLPSGADATNAIAILSSGSINDFVKKMNNLSKKIGLNNTNFVNVTGLDEENHYSTVSDVTKLLVYSLKNKIFKKIYTTKEYEMSNGLVVTNSIYSYNKNDELDISKILGSKTGYTLNAGYCLSSLSNVNGHDVLIITLNAKKEDKSFYNIIDTLNLIDFLENNYDERLLVKKGKHIKNIYVDLSNISKYSIKTQNNVKKFLPSDYNKNDLKIKYTGFNHISFLNIKGTKIGTLKYYYKNKLFYEEKVILNKKIDINFIKTLKASWFILLLAILLIVYICYKKNLPNNKNLVS